MRGVLVVLADVDPEHEAAWNLWYDEEHVPERVAVTGVRSARRFVRYEGAAQPDEPSLDARRGAKYLAIYEFDDIDVLHGEWEALTRDPSERSRSMFPHMANVTREAYVLLSEDD